MRNHRLSDQRGIALAVAVFALVIIGVVVAGTFFAGRLEQRSGLNTLFAAEAAEAAEAGVSWMAGNWNADDNDMAVATSRDLAVTRLGANGYSTPTVSRLTPSLFLLSAQGEWRNNAGTVLAQRRVATLARLNDAGISVNAGLTALGRVTVTGNSTVDGHDQTPANWTAPEADCPPPEDKAGIMYNGTLSQGGSAQIDGEPPTQQNSSLTPGNILGGTTFDELAALKTKTITGNVSGLAPQTTGTPPVCDKSVASNWGAPQDKTSPCFGYFPIIYHNGDLSISGNGAGQGILLVDGDLQVQGRIDFYGPVIVTGSVDIRGTGSDDVKFYGGIIAQDVNVDDSRLSGNATINYSSCAVQRALTGSATVAPLAERSWVQLYR